jgi:hypothetical protein
MVNLDSGSTGGTVHIFSLSMRTDHIGISFGLPLIGKPAAEVRVVDLAP